MTTSEQIGDISGFKWSCAIRSLKKVLSSIEQEMRMAH